MRKKGLSMWNVLMLCNSVSSFVLSTIFSIYYIFYLLYFLSIIFSIYYIFYLLYFLSIIFSIYYIFYYIFYLLYFLSIIFSIYYIFYLLYFLSIIFSIDLQWIKFYSASKMCLHRWLNGSMLACHAEGPGSFPGRCRHMQFGFMLKMEVPCALPCP